MEADRRNSEIIKSSPRRVSKSPLGQNRSTKQLQALLEQAEKEKALLEVHSKFIHGYEAVMSYVFILDT